MDKNYWAKYAVDKRLTLDSLETQTSWKWKAEEKKYSMQTVTAKKQGC